MRQVPQILTDTWLGGEFTGARRPMARVTVQKLNIKLQQVDPKRLFASAMFGQADIPRELPNVKSVEWDRSTGSDVASCTIVLYNTAPLPLGQHPTPAGDFDLPGSYTYNYGATSWSTARWGTTANATWQDILVPDRMIRTYEGYGFSPPPVAPEKDPHLVQTGTWLIDDVQFGTDGLITLSCRDVGRLLLDHIMFPPVIPLATYPLQWTPTHDVDNPDVVSTVGSTWRPTYSTDSGKPYFGKNGLVHGHRPSFAFDSNATTYWLSVGNSLPKAGYSFEFIEGNCGGKTVSTVTFKTYGGPYRAFLSIKVKGKWLGTHTIPYNPRDPVSAPNGSNIPYYSVTTAGRETSTTFHLKTPIAKVEAIRLTFTDLYNSGIGPYRYRAGVRDVLCSSQHQVTKDGGTHVEGDYDDYTQVVKYLLACGGFHWPRTSMAFLTYSDGTKVTLKAPDDDAILKSGRVWGDLEMCHTKAIYVYGDIGSLGADAWDKKPLMDGVAYVRDLLGYVFFIDEGGGAVFRLPNQFSLGNYVGDLASNAGYLLSPDSVQSYVVQAGGMYPVVAGDNWITVAAKVHTTEAALLAANAVRGGAALSVGQQLVIPAGGAYTYTVLAGDSWITVATKVGMSEAALLAANASRGGGALIVGEHLHLGTADSWAMIAALFAVTVAALQGANTLRGSSPLKGGEELAIPDRTGTAHYVVRAGDNWVTLAARMVVTEAALLAANASRGGGALSVGETINIPPRVRSGIDPIITIDERQTLLGLHAKISSKNVRESIFVANTTGQFGAVSAGYNPLGDSSGFRRVGGWTDQNFASAAEAQRMADMITMAQAFTYRTDTLTILANPAIQIDDQVRIFERISNEGSIHYVKGIRSRNDLESGQWTYDLDTNWLGENPLGAWAFDMAKLNAATKSYLDLLKANRPLPTGLGQ